MFQNYTLEKIIFYLIKYGILQQFTDKSNNVVYIVLFCLWNVIMLLASSSTNWSLYVKLNCSDNKPVTNALWLPLVVSC